MSAMARASALVLPACQHLTNFPCTHQLIDGNDQTCTPVVGFSDPEPLVSDNKATVESYMEGFRNSDHELILSCLTDDVVWDIPGAFHVAGKKAFDREIENEAFVGKPAISVSRMTEENNVVVAEGEVRVQRRAGDFVNLAFCDVFVMQRGKIRQLISYLVPVEAPVRSAQ
jgi:ketosteroid isomerase-like protein